MLNESFEKTITDTAVERWRYPRFFTENIGKTAVITGPDAAHISRVLRMKSGDLAIVCDGRKTDCLCRIITADSSCVELEILDKRENEAEPSVYLRLFQCLPKGDKLEFIVQKAVELGASEVIPVVSKRCVSRPDPKSAAKKLERYRRIAEEAAKQCGRGILPKIGETISFGEAVKSVNPKGLGLIFYECGGESLTALTSGVNSGFIDVFIGSEGGFEEAEVELALKAGIHAATLGKRILRCETAPIAAISVLMNLTGNM